MEDRKKSGIITCPNPLALSGATDMGMSAIHGMAESIKKESTIDYPVSEGLCPEVWDQTENSYVIKDEIKQKATELVDKLLARYHVEAKGVNVVGSICSNQYTEDADIDVHILVDLPQEVADRLNSMRKLEQDQIFKDDYLFFGLHPLEFYFQPNIYADMGSCGCYDLMNDKWLSGPQLVDLEFDPYEEYEQSWNEAFEFGTRVQTALFELRKNLYKYNAILEQASNQDIYSNGVLMSMVERRLEEVKDEIRENMRVIAELKDEMVQVRRRANMNPRTPEEAEDMRTNHEWLTANSTFKFLQRLNVIDSCWFIAQLYRLVESE